jgi:Domain of unknown function (DUF4471)
MPAQYSKHALYTHSYKHCHQQEVASIIHFRQYRGWRTAGLAFEFGDQVYDQPNRTMLSYAEGMVRGGEHAGRKKEVQWASHFHLRMST